MLVTIILILFTAASSSGDSDVNFKAVPSFSDSDVNFKAVPSFSDSDVNFKAVPSFSDLDVNLKAAPSFNDLYSNLEAVASSADVDFNAKARNFSIELLHHATQYADGNVALSPYVIWSLLISMAYETVDVTWQQLSKVLSLTEDRREAVERFRSLRTSVLVNEGVFINLLNFIFYDENFHIYYDGISRIETDFRFITQRLNFEESNIAAQAAMRILQAFRVPLRTLIRAEDFVDSTMIMCNYLVFKAKWAYPFHAYKTTPVMYNDGNKTAKINMMYTKAPFRVSDFESLKATVTELPYEGDGKYCMLLIRPHSGYDINQVYRNLRKFSLKDVLAKLQSDADELGFNEVEIELPKYANNLRMTLNKPLFSMGLTDMFDRNFANFDNFAEDKIYIYDIVHRVTIIMTETDTVVHSTTPAYASRGFTPSKRTAFREPFIFFIMEKSTATILFGGSYSKVDLY